MKTCIDCIHVGWNGLGHRRCLFPLPAWNGKNSPNLASEKNCRIPYAYYNGVESINIAERCLQFKLKSREDRKIAERQLAKLRKEQVLHDKKFHPSIKIWEQY